MSTPKQVQLTIPDMDLAFVVQLLVMNLRSYSAEIQRLQEELSKQKKEAENKLRREVANKNDIIDIISPAFQKAAPKAYERTWKKVDNLRLMQQAMAEAERHG